MEIFLVSFISGLVCLALPKRFRAAASATAFAASAACLYFSVQLFLTKQVDYQVFSLSLFKADGLNVFLAPFMCMFGFLIILYSLGGASEKIACLNKYYCYMLWTLGSSCAAVLANNIILFLIMWGFGAMLLYLLVGIQNPQAASAAAKKTFILVGGSDAVMLFGAAILWKLTGSFDMDKMRVAVVSKAAAAAFIAFLIGALTKAGAMPFHTWIPDSSLVAPMPVMAYLPAALDKLLGIYLLARCALYIFVIPANSFLSMLLMLIGAGTVICAVMMALIQRNFRKLLSYHAVSQVGYMVLGIGTGTAIGIAGGLFHMLNHAIYKSCLFLGAGNVEYRTGESELDKLGGLANAMPVTFISCLIASLSISGIPPFNGFFSKWMIYQGLLAKLAPPFGFTVFLCLIAAMAGSALTLASFAKLLYSVFFNTPQTPYPAQALPKEAPWNMRAGVLFLAALSVCFGVFANSIPLKYFIYPALPKDITVSFIGDYAPVISTALIVIGFITGALIYCVSLANRAVRRDISFIGGEKAGQKEAVQGSEFYNTIKEIGFINIFYEKAEAGIFDIYQQGKNAVFTASRFFQYLHNGILPTYLVWALLGMIGLFLFLLR